MAALKHISSQGCTKCDCEDVRDELDAIVHRIVKPALDETDSSTCSSKQNDPATTSGLQSPVGNAWQQQQPQHPLTKSTRRLLLKNKTKTAAGTLSPHTKSTSRSTMNHKKPLAVGKPSLAERCHSSAPHQRLDRAHLTTKSKSVSDLGRRVRHIESAREMTMKKSMKSRFLHIRCGVYVLSDLATAEAEQDSKLEARHIESANEMAMKKSIDSRFFHAKGSVYVLEDLAAADADQESKLEVNDLANSSDLPPREAPSTHNKNKNKNTEVEQQPKKPERKKHAWDFGGLSIMDFDDLSILTDDKTFQEEYMEDFPVVDNKKRSRFHRRKKRSPAQSIRLAPTMAEF